MQLQQDSGGIRLRRGKALRAEVSGRHVSLRLPTTGFANAYSVCCTKQRNKTEEWRFRSLDKYTELWEYFLDASQTS